MAEKHTGGPWIYEKATETIRNKPGNYWIATMNSWDKAVDNQANARLIAAAPELLEAAQDCIVDLVRYTKHVASQKYNGEGTGPDYRLEALQAAITQATGESRGE